MWNFVGGFVGELLVNGAVSASEQAIYNWSFLSCLAVLTAVHFFIRYKIYGKIEKGILSKHFSWGKLFTIIVVVIVALYLYLYLRLRESGYLLDICEWFGLLMAQHIHLPGYGVGIQINLD